MGSAFGAMQLVLYFIYHNNQGYFKTREQFEFGSSFWPNTILNQQRSLDQMRMSSDVRSNDLQQPSTMLVVVDEKAMEMDEPKPAQAQQKGALTISNGNAA